MPSWVMTRAALFSMRPSAFRTRVEEDGAALVGSEVEADGALVAVELVEVAGAVVVVRPDVGGNPGERAGGGLGVQLDLDDVGAEVGEVASRDRSRPVGGDLDEAQSRQRPLSGGGGGDGRRGHFRVRPGEVRGEDGVGVLARSGGGRGGVEGGPRKLAGEAGGEQLAVSEAKRPEPVAGGELLAGGNVGHRVHGGDGDAELLGGVVDLLLRPRLRPLAEGFQDLVETAPSRREAAAGDSSSSRSKRSMRTKRLG